MATEDEIIEETAFLLNASGAGQTVEAEDSETIRERITKKLDDLNKRGIVGVTDIADLDEGAVNWFSVCLANALAPGFGKTMDGSAIQYAEKMLRAQNERVVLDKPVKAVYY